MEKFKKDDISKEDAEPLFLRGLRLAGFLIVAYLSMVVPFLILGFFVASKLESWS